MKLTNSGLIITISLLCAAGLAAYENPQVRQWIDESRRKVAIALHSLGDELAPEESKRTSNEASPDPSTREDEDPEAVERRRRARQEILERGRMMEERRKPERGSASKAKSFDDLVDKDGALKKEETNAMTTAAEPKAEEPGLRHRRTESQAAALGSAFANPFEDKSNIGSPATLRSDPAYRSYTPSPPASSVSPPVPPKPAAYQPQRLLIDTEENSNHPSEQLVDLTPTTSASSANPDLAELNNQPHVSQTNFWSINEWAVNNSASGTPYSLPRTEPTGIEELSESVTLDSQADSEDFDGMSASDDGAGISTPDTWTEAGSVVG